MKNNSTGIEAILGNSHIVYTKIVIDREEIENTNFKVVITQKVADHDTFEIICPTETLEGFGAYPLTKSRDYLGEKITIKLKQYGEEAFSINGIVTSVKTKKFDGYEGNVIISGYSPTILLENGLESQSFEKSSLKDIVSEATQGYPQDVVQFVLKPNYTDPITYTVQYKESDYQFIKRLAKRYGEWLYYNGKEIVFGNNNEEVIELEEESEMFEYEMKMEVTPQKFNYISYVPKYGKDITVESTEANETSYNNPFLDHALQKSKKTFQKVPTSLYNHKLMDQGSSDLKDAVQLQKDKRANVFFVEGKSRKPEVRIGALIKLTGYKHSDSKAFSGGKVPLETYRVTEVTHIHEGMDDYYNIFKAVPREITVPDYMDDDAVPVCEEQSAIVTDNNDPEGMSRIRVRFPWQKGNNGQSPWIRVTTPYAGKGKGFHVIPEVGEEVITGFENGNAEKPFVLGAMFHAEGKSGHKGSGNFIKGFTTASGNKVEMDDEKKTVTISDPSGNTVTMNGDGTMTISAPNKIDIKSKEINIDASEKMTLNGTNTLTIDSKEITATGSTSVKVNSDTLIESVAPKVALNGTAQIDLDSKIVNMNGTAMTNVKGGVVNLN